MTRHMTYANLMASIAVFVALGGTGYAAVKVNGKNIKNKSIAGKKLKRDTLSGSQIKESTLKTVPRAQSADRAASADSANTATTAGNANTLDGKDSASFRLRCPAGMQLDGDICFEAIARGSGWWITAVLECGKASRRLPTLAELLQLAHGAAFAEGDHYWTQDSHDPNYGYSVSKHAGGGLSLNNSPKSSTPLAYRCVSDPAN